VRLDPNSKEYKKKYNRTALRWTAGIMAMPVLIVTSYYLFDRRESLVTFSLSLPVPEPEPEPLLIVFLVALGNPQKVIPEKYRRRPDLEATDSVARAT
jgi:hypothetical protein